MTYLDMWVAEISIVLQFIVKPRGSLYGLVVWVDLWPVIYSNWSLEN